jgi:hypothetical protein
MRLAILTDPHIAELHSAPACLVSISASENLELQSGPGFPYGTKEELQQLFLIHQPRYQ